MSFTLDVSANGLKKDPIDALQYALSLAQDGLLSRLQAIDDEDEAEKARESLRQSADVLFDLLLEHEERKQEMEPQGGDNVLHLFAKTHQNN